MNRRRFLELMGMAVAGGAVAYSFPSVIVSKNLIVEPVFNYRQLGYDLSSYGMMPRGIRYVIGDETRIHQGFARMFAGVQL